jgi:hypothetical protein
MLKLTKRLVDAPEARVAEYFVLDSQNPSFGLRLLPTGRKGYLVQYRASSRSQRFSFGPSTVLTCERARNRAMAIRAALRSGEDAAAERDPGRKASKVKEPEERSDMEQIATRVKARTSKEYPKEKRERFIGAAELRRIRACL